jgi:hypothetical protein
MTKLYTVLWDNKIEKWKVGDWTEGMDPKWYQKYDNYWFAYKEVLRRNSEGAGWIEYSSNIKR